MQLTQNSAIPARTPGKKSPAAPAFPSSRYFQIHFEYLHEIIGGLQLHLAETNQRMAVLQQRLDALADHGERDAAQP
ncbi:hypothetical protein [Methylogaea oryzae]|uniref:Uncharacterized protein n=1 Tax=Methylogaea oryzae TaxID=1295382 RepID=A0A8D4VMX7_9GAMM|nr:hypothetical protein [Methylogaea oryzae]BBL71138.1 hypothetical protein MoryE10_17440 [Methylogaea oryzae]